MEASFVSVDTANSMITSLLINYVASYRDRIVYIINNSMIGIARFLTFPLDGRILWTQSATIKCVCSCSTFGFLAIATAHELKVISVLS